MEKLRQGISAVFDKILYGFIYLWTGIYTRHKQHPRIGKFIYYLAVAYAVAMLITLTHSYSSVKHGLYRVFPKLKNASAEYTGHADNCADLSIKNIMNCVDVFVLAHFVGYAIRGVVFRDHGFCWLMSITWEITEVAFRHLNPISFLECWWDAIILDILLTNAVGIFFGMYMCKRLNLKLFCWDSNVTRHKDSADGKETTKVLSWDFRQIHTKDSAYRRVIPICIMLVVSQIEELNFFFMKKIMRIPPGHALCLLRTYVISTMASPAVLGTYNALVAADRLGSSAYLWLGIIVAEAVVNLKFGHQLFKKLNTKYVLYWLIIQIVLSACYLFISTTLSKRRLKRKNSETDIEEINELKKQNGHLENGLTNGYAINIGETPIHGPRLRTNTANGLPLR